MRKKIFPFGVLIIVFLLLANAPSLSATASKKLANDHSFFPDFFKKQTLFESLANDSELVQITLTSEFKKLIRKKFESAYQPAQFEYIDKNGQTVRYDVQLKARGKSRKKICYMPPLKVKFSKDDLKAKGLKKTNTYKIVTYCKSGKINEQLILKEYLAYKLYNEMTPYSFRVQLAKIKYVDSSGKKKPQIAYGFLIENTDEMAKRLDAEICDCKNIKAEMTEREPFNTLSMFQYMIGNTDWRVKLMHNIKLLRPAEGKKLIAVPYDFDYSGLVNAAYAVPDPSINISSVTHRLFMGIKNQGQMMQPTVDLFLKKEAAILKIVETDKFNSERNKKYMLTYLKAFFKTIKNKKQLRREKIME